VTIDQATVEACSVTGLETSAVDQRRWFPRRYVVPPQLTDEHALWTVAVVLGASGSGKSLALKAVKGSEKRPGRTHWPARESVASEIARLLGEGEGGVADAMERWLGLRQTASRRPHAQLSAGDCLSLSLSPLSPNALPLPVRHPLSHAQYLQVSAIWQIARTPWRRRGRSPRAGASSSTSLPRCSTGGSPRARVPG